MCVGKNCTLLVAALRGVRGWGSHQMCAMWVAIEIHFFVRWGVLIFFALACVFVSQAESSRSRVVMYVSPCQNVCSCWSV